LTPALPLVWFERPVLPEVHSDVAAACRILGPATDDDPQAGIEGAVAVIAGPGAYDAAVMDRAPGLRVIARTGIGYDGIDVTEATRRGIAVCNTPDGPTISTAEHAVALMLLVAKNVRRAEGALRMGLRQGYYARHDGLELHGKRLGLVGFGRIGRHVAKIAAGLGMDVTVFDPYLFDAVPEGIRRAERLDDLLAAADVVSLHLPLTDASRGLFGEREFAAMKRGGVFINTARGGLVDQDALEAALVRGHLFGAGLDVTSPEPLPPGHPLLTRDDVVVTPHVASATREGRVRMFREAFAQAIDALAGRSPAHLVNPEVWQDHAAHTSVGVRT
jgi:D-3-phosphoglycerate dehydrogenase